MSLDDTVEWVCLLLRGIPRPPHRVGMTGERPFNAVLVIHASTVLGAVTCEPRFPVSDKGWKILGKLCRIHMGRRTLWNITYISHLG